MLAWIRCARFRGIQVRLRLAPEEGALFLKGVESSVDAARKQVRHDSAESSDEKPARRPVAERRADAVMQMVETAIVHGPAAAEGGDKYLVHIHTDEQTLTDGAGLYGEIEDGPALSFDTLRRVTCDCATVTITTKNGQPLSVGRKTHARARRSSARCRRRSAAQQPVTCAA